VGNQRGGCCAPTIGPAGPRPPDGRALTAPSPRPVPPAQTRGTRDGLTPNRQLELAPPRRFHTNYVCMRGYRPAPTPPGGTHDPPPLDPRIRAETSATSAERRRTRPSHRATRAPVGVHTTPWLFTPSTQRQRSRALLTQRDRHPRADPTARPEGRRATHASDPPHTLANTQGTNAARLQCRQSHPPRTQYSLSSRSG